MTHPDVERAPTTAGIYGIFHVDTCRPYIGQAGNFRERWQKHMVLLRHNKHHCHHFHFAWNVYGPEHFRFIILEILPGTPTREQLKEREQAWADLFPNRFNTNPVAGSCLGLKRGPFTPEHRAKLSEARKRNRGWKRPAAALEKFRAAMTGRKRGPQTPEWRAKISAGNKGKTPSAEHRARISEANRNRASHPQTAETRAKISATWKRRAQELKAAGLAITGKPLCQSPSAPQTIQQLSLDFSQL